MRSWRSGGVGRGRDEGDGEEGGFPAFRTLQGFWGEDDLRRFTVVCRLRFGWDRSAEQSAGVGQAFRLTNAGQEAAVTDSDEAPGQHVEQESPGEVAC